MTLFEFVLQKEKDEQDNWKISRNHRSEISMAEQKGIQSPVSHSDKGTRSPNVIEGSKEENEAVIHSDKSPHHHKETHGTSDDIDENTPIGEVKGPSVFQRVKEEVEAVVEAVHPKK